MHLHGLFRPLAVFACATLLVACEQEGSLGPSSSPSLAPPPHANLPPHARPNHNIHLFVSPFYFTGDPGDVVAATATVRDRSGVPQAGLTVTFSTSEPGTTLKVGSQVGLSVQGVTDQDGQLVLEWTLAPRTGTHAVTVAVVDSRASATITADVGAVESSIDWVAIDPQAVSVRVGQAATLVATAYDVYDNPISGVVWSWRSNDATVASVSQAGVITGHAVGTTDVFASTGYFTAHARITVTQ
jgi:hypothetical protein